MANTELTHHGIKGMHWGVRRTPEQLERDRGHINAASSIVNEAKKINNSVSNIRSNTKKKDVSKMTDQELRDKVNRLNLEQQYSQLSGNRISKGQQYVRNTLEVAGSTLAIASSIVGIAAGIKQLKG